jgi:hypothetical protein
MRDGDERNSKTFCTFPRRGKEGGKEGREGGREREGGRRQGRRQEPGRQMLLPMVENQQC